MFNPAKSMLLIVIFLMMPLPVLAGSSAQDQAILAVSEKEKKSGAKTGDRTGKILRFAVHVSKMGKMDPHFAAGSQDRTFADMVFNGLLRYKPGNAPSIEPDLAAEMPMLKTINGSQVWTIPLRKGVMFHPGPKTPSYEFTADDVVFSFTKAADPKRSAYAGDYDGIRVNKIDRYTVEFILANPLSSILFFPKITNYNGGFVVSQKALETMGYDNYLKHPVGTGPFMFKARDPGKNLSLSAHGDYFRGKPELDGVELHFVPEIEKRRAGPPEGGDHVIIRSGKKRFTKKPFKNPRV